jgi:hypothetical protein
LESKSTTEGLIHPSQPNKPRLTMKHLLALIQDLQLQDHLLAQKLEQFEQQLSGFIPSRDEVAAADEQLHVQEEFLPQGIQISRAKRHATPKKKSFGLWRYFT